MAAAKDCPKCGLVNPPDAQTCDCGWDFLTSRHGRPIGQPADMPGFGGNHKFVSRARQQFGGLLMVLIAIAGIAWTWHIALQEGYYDLQASIGFPAFLALGLGMILAPGYKEERIGRGEDISRLSGVALITPRWWGVLIAGIFAGLVNWALLASL
jgi:hypothetical protein